MFSTRPNEIICKLLWCCLFLIGSLSSSWTQTETILISEIYSNNNVSTTCEASGGGITLADGSTATSICIDGVEDPLEVIRDGNGAGTNRTFVITDDQGNILAIPGAGMNGPFNLDPAGPGTCEIWYLGYEDDLTGLETGNNLTDLDGCFGLSNPITVVRQAPDGGMVSLLSGATDTLVTAGNALVPVTHVTTATALSYWYIITDDNNNILAFQNSTVGNVLDLSGAPAGTCRIWGWSYRGLPAPVAGENISTLNDDSCEEISGNFITVVREEPNATEDINPANVRLAIWPNPVQSELQIDIDLEDRPDFIQLEVRSALGQLLIKRDLSVQPRLRTSVDMNHLPTGTYILSIRTDSTINTQQFIKQ